VLPVSEPHAGPAGEVADELRGRGFRVEVDARPETLGKRIREAELEKVPYVIVWGERESRDALSVRTRGGGQATLSLDALSDELSQAATI
jgi:threonyl-tRNA synthetase